MFDTSRYLKTTLFKRPITNTYVLRLRERHTFNMQRCQVHEWTRGDTLDGISYKYYGNSAFRWAILDANPNYRTEFDIKCGDLISIPSYDEVLQKVN